MSCFSSFLHFIHFEFVYKAFWRLEWICDLRMCKKYIMFSSRLDLVSEPALAKQKLLPIGIVKTGHTANTKMPSQHQDNMHHRSSHEQDTIGLPLSAGPTLWLAIHSLQQAVMGQQLFFLEKLLGTPSGWRCITRKTFSIWVSHPRVFWDSFLPGFIQDWKIIRLQNSRVQSDSQASTHTLHATCSTVVLNRSSFI